MRFIDNALHRQMWHQVGQWNQLAKDALTTPGITPQEQAGIADFCKNKKRNLIHRIRLLRQVYFSAHQEYMQRKNAASGANEFKQEK